MAPVRLLLVDACVLIDFALSDVSVLALVSAHVGQVHVPTPVFDEVEQIDETMAASLGIKLVEPTIEMLAGAGAARGRLSFQDRICVMVAKAGGFTCVSNDRRVRMSCASEGVSVMWGLELLVELVVARAMPPESARDVARRIVAASKRIDRQVYAAFLARIGLTE